MPIQLLLEPPFANRALDNVLLRGNEITWLTVDHHPDHLSQLQQLFTSSRPTVERLHVYSDYFRGWTTEAQKVREIWQHFPLLRELFVSRHFVPINQFTAPNLVHLALEHTGNILNVTVKSLLDMLSGCPLLETLLLDYSDILPPGTIRGHPSIRFPRLRTIEVGGYEVHSRLITYLDFPPNVAVGFRMMRTSDVCGTIPHAVLSSIQHVFTRIDVRSITLAAATHYKGHILIRVRFEGPHGSLEITVGDIQDHTQPQRLLFGPEGVLFSHSSHIENVTELQVVGCFFHTDHGFDRVNAAMPNVDTISFSQCDGPHVFGLLTSGNPSSPPFPRLERVMVLGSESRLEEMARRRRDLGVPLKTLAIGRGHGDFEYEPLEDYTALGGLVGDLRTRCPVEMWWWDTENEILRRWSAISASVMVSLGWNVILLCLTPLYSFSFMNRVSCLGFIVSTLHGRMLDSSGVIRNKRR